MKYDLETELGKKIKFDEKNETPNIVVQKIAKMLNRIVTKPGCIFYDLSNNLIEFNTESIEGNVKFINGIELNCHNDKGYFVEAYGDFRFDYCVIGKIYVGVEGIKDGYYEISLDSRSVDGKISYYDLDSIEYIDIMNPNSDFCSSKYYSEEGIVPDEIKKFYVAYANYGGDKSNIYNFMYCLITGDMDLLVKDFCNNKIKVLDYKG